MGVKALTLLLPFLAIAQDSPLREAVRFDQQQKCGDAERIYQQLLSQGPPTTALLNNHGNHYLICGDAEKARLSFERLLKLNPQHENANLQLARIATERKQGTQALQYLARVTDPAPQTRLLRAEALYWAGKKPEAFLALDDVAKAAEAEPQLEYLYGLTSARIGAYDRAVAAFNTVLVRHPDDFDVLFNLGRAAARAKSFDRAQQTLEVALKLQPDNAEVLLELAGVNIARRDYARAIYVLVHAEQVAPGRPEIVLALAHAAQDGGYYGDAAVAFDQYLRLKPEDSAAQRDCALAYGLTDARQADGLKKLREYIHRHPTDALGLYYLAQLTWREDPQSAMQSLESSLRLDPKFAPAHVDLGWLLNRQGSSAAAIPHFEKAIVLQPTDARALDQLGMAYLTLDRPIDSEKVLRKAGMLSPADPEIMMHLGRALIESGRETEGRELIEKFKRERPVSPRGPWRQAGMIESASLSAPERSRHEVERLRREATLHPDDPELEFRLASLMLANGDIKGAEEAFRVLLSRNPDGRLCQRAGDFLLSFERFLLARAFLERAIPSSPAASVDLATAVFYSDGGGAALTILNGIPDSQKNGDSWVLEAKILYDAGRYEESAKTLEHGLTLTTSNSKVAQEAVLLLVQQGRRKQALEFLAESAKGIPDLLLIRAMLLVSLGQRAEADKELRDIEAQWPEWDRPYLIQGILLERSDPQAAKQKLETSIALGSSDQLAKCILSRLAANSRSPNQIHDAVQGVNDCSCTAEIENIMQLPCAKP